MEHWSIAPPLRGEPGATRYGEADHPGPGNAAKEGGWVREGAAKFRDPKQRGFRYALQSSPEGDTVDHIADGHLALVIDTVNGTTWSSIRRYLHRTAADLVLIQEHHLGPEAIPAAKAWALRHGWQPVITPAVRGDGDGWRGGVGILARRHLGISPPRIGPYEIVQARAVAALVEAPGYRPFTAVSLYLQHGDGLSQDNLRMLEAVGAGLESQGQHVPFVPGGYMQCDPTTMAAAGFANRSGSTRVATRDPRGTCRSSTAATELVV